VSGEDFSVTDRYEMGAMAAMMRHPAVYWSATDALAPQPEEMDFESHLAHPDTWTVAATFRGVIIGYIQFIKRTSVMAEIHTGFLPQFRGLIAKNFIKHCIGLAFTQKGLTKLCAMIPSDNKPAIYLARNIGFKEEGRLTKAVVRRVKDGPPLRDLVLLCLSRVKE